MHIFLNKVYLLFKLIRATDLYSMYYPIYKQYLQTLQMCKDLHIKIHGNGVIATSALQVMPESQSTTCKSLHKHSDPLLYSPFLKYTKISTNVKPKT